MNCQLGDQRLKLRFKQGYIVINESLRGLVSYWWLDMVEIEKIELDMFLNETIDVDGRVASEVEFWHIINKKTLLLLPRL